MCTVTILRAGDMLRVACNRDESRQRPLAFAPYIRRHGSMLALAPQDSQARGTWIGANSAGLVFAILNVHDNVAAGAGAARSRGLVIPALLDCDSLADVAGRLDLFSSGAYAPFRLVVADPRGVLVTATRRDHVEYWLGPLSHPLLFTSSSVGDALADGPRRHLFEQMFETPYDIAAQQDAYHAHRWRDRPAVSVHMSRPDACTVSTTTVEVTPTQVRMFYAPAHCDAGTPAGLTLDRLGVARNRSRDMMMEALAS